MQSTTQEPRQTSSEVKTVLQYMARTNRQLLVFYGSAMTAGWAVNRPGIAFAALALAGLPQISMILLSVIDPSAIQALGSDFSASVQGPGAAHPLGGGDVGSVPHQLGSGSETRDGLEERPRPAADEELSNPPEGPEDQQLSGI